MGINECLEMMDQIFITILWYKIYTRVGGSQLFEILIQSTVFTEWKNKRHIDWDI